MFFLDTITLQNFAGLSILKSENNPENFRNIKNSLRYSNKTSTIMDFVYTNPPIMVTSQAPRADKVSEVVSKVPQEDFDYTCKKSY